MKPILLVAMCVLAVNTASASPEIADIGTLNVESPFTVIMCSGDFFALRGVPPAKQFSAYRSLGSWRQPPGHDYAPSVSRALSQTGGHFHFPAGRDAAIYAKENSLYIHPFTSSHRIEKSQSRDWSDWSNPPLAYKVSELEEGVFDIQTAALDPSALYRIKDVVHAALVTELKNEANYLAAAGEATYTLFNNPGKTQSDAMIAEKPLRNQLIAAAVEVKQKFPQSVEKVTVGKVWVHEDENLRAGGLDAFKRSKRPILLPDLVLVVNIRVRSEQEVREIEERIRNTMPPGLRASLRFNVMLPDGTSRGEG